MNKFAPTILAVALTIPGVAYADGHIVEIESNHPAQSAQRISVPVPGSVTVEGVLGRTLGLAINDLDFYTFYAQQGEVFTFDIDGGIGGARDVNTILAVFGPGPSFEVLRQSNDVPDDQPIDEGSTSRFDALIENFTANTTGYYTVGVSNYPRFFVNGGIALGTSLANGDYKLVISSVSEPILHISINIKPGTKETEYAPINLKARGKIPVALLSSPGFNAVTVDTASLTFGHSGQEASLSSCARDGEDFNGDGVLDLMCHFDNQAAGFQVDDIEAVLRGKAANGQIIEGRGLLKVVPGVRRP